MMVGILQIKLFSSFQGQRAVWPNLHIDWIFHIFSAVEEFQF